MAVALVAQDKSPLHTEKAYVYKSTAPGPWQMTVYSPLGVKAGDGRAAILFMPGTWHRWPAYFSERGMVTAVIARRKGQDADRRLVTLHAVEAYRSGIRWFRSHAKELGADPDRIAVNGGSASADAATLTLLADSYDAEGEDLTISAKPNALVLFYPGAGRFSDALRTPDEKSKAAKPEKSALPPLDARGEDFNKLMHSPFENVLKKGSPPMVLFYGTADRLLPGGREFARGALALGIRAELYTATDQTHRLFDDPRWHDAVLYKADEFLASLGYLQGKPTVKIAPDSTAVLKKELP
jgi:hypothetical protein